MCAGPRTLFYVKGIDQQEKHVCRMARFYFIRGGCGGSGQPFRVNSMGESWKRIKENVRLGSPQSALVAIHRVGQHKSNDFTETTCLRINEPKKLLINYL